MVNEIVCIVDHIGASVWKTRVKAFAGSNKIKLGIENDMPVTAVKYLIINQKKQQGIMRRKITISDIFSNDVIPLSKLFYPCTQPTKSHVATLVVFCKVIDMHSGSLC